MGQNRRYLAKNVSFGPKFIWEKGTFLFAQLCLVVAKTCRPARSERFFGPKPRISERWSILHLRIDFPTFRFRGTAVFVKKKPAGTSKSLSQPHSEVTVCQ